MWGDGEYRSLEKLKLKDRCSVNISNHLKMCSLLSLIEEKPTQLVFHLIDMYVFSFIPSIHFGWWRCVCLCVLQCPTRPGTCSCHVITERTGQWRCPGALLTKDTASSESILWVLFICIKLNHSKDNHSSDTDITSCMFILPQQSVHYFTYNI